MSLPNPDDAAVVVSDRVRLTDDRASPRWVPGVIHVDRRTGTIAAVEEGAGAVIQARAGDAPGDATTTRDFGDRPVTPAFVNAHTHLALAFVRGPAVGGAAGGNLVEDLFYVRERALLPGDVRAFARMGAGGRLLGGVGSVWDHYFAGEEVAGALADVGLSGVVAPTLQDLSGPGASRWEAALEQTASLAGDGRLRRQGIYAAVGPHAPDTVSGALWGRAVDLAERHGLPVHAHLAQSAAEVGRVEAREGTTPLAWLSRLGVLDRAPSVVLAHGLFLRRAALSRLRPDRHLLVHCPAAQAVFGFPGPVRAWMEAGVSFAVATDAAAGNDSVGLQKELRQVAGARTADLVGTAIFDGFFTGDLDADAVEAARALRHGGRAGERLADPAFLLSRVLDVPGAWHPGMTAGRLVPGALANLLVWDPTHPAFWPATDLDRALAFGETTGGIHAMLVAGRELGQAGDFHRSLLGSDDYREAREEADARLAALIRRC